MMWLLQRLVEQTNACCEYGFIRSFDGWPAHEVARRLGVGEKTVRNWRNCTRRQIFTCPLGHGCPFFTGIPLPTPGRATEAASKSADPSPEASDLSTADDTTEQDPKK